MALYFIAFNDVSGHLTSTGLEEQLIAKKPKFTSSLLTTHHRQYVIVNLQPIIALL
jgi:hypothetical protein